MKIAHYHKDEDGVLRFLVGRKKYQEVRDHLISKKLNPGGREHFDDEQSEIIIEGFLIDEVNEALADFESERFNRMLAKLEGRVSQLRTKRDELYNKFHAERVEDARYSMLIEEEEQLEREIAKLEGRRSEEDETF